MYSFRNDVAVRYIVEKILPVRSFYRWVGNAAAKNSFVIELGVDPFPLKVVGDEGADNTGTAIQSI